MAKTTGSGTRVPVRPQECPLRMQMQSEPEHVSTIGHTATTKTSQSKQGFEGQHSRALPRENPIDLERP
jgi:hypothetical protein